MKKLALLIPIVLALAVSACNSGSESSAGSTGGGAEVSEGSTAARAGGGGSNASGDQLVSSPVPQVGPQIVKTATLQLGIGHGSFDDKAGEAHVVADSLGGFVVESFASQGSGKRIAAGSLVMRIPAESYDTALSRLRGLGEVERLVQRKIGVARRHAVGKAPDVMGLRGSAICARSRPSCSSYCSGRTTSLRRWPSRPSCPRSSSISSRRAVVCSTSRTASPSRRSP